HLIIFDSIVVYINSLCVFSFLFFLVFFFFFFQAEDGIRDDLVTGVQTCALPISIAGSSRNAFMPSGMTVPSRPATSMLRSIAVRSEERRVGKECRSGWSPDNEKKKKKK